MIRRQPFEVRVGGQPNGPLPPALPVAIPAAAPAAIPAAIPAVNAVNQNPQPPRPPSASPSQQQLAGEFKTLQILGQKNGFNVLGRITIELGKKTQT